VLNLKVFIFALLFIFALIGLWLGMKWARMRRVFRFQSRDNLADADWFNCFYANSGLSEKEVMKTLHFVSDALEIPSGLLRPSDRFKIELAPIVGWEYDDGMVELFWLLKDLATKKNIGSLPEINTIDEFIRFVVPLKTDCPGNFF